MRPFCRSVWAVAVVFIMIACKDEEEVSQSIALSITEISDSSRLLDWEEVKNAQGYSVWRSIKRVDGFDDPVLIASVDFLTLSYVDESLPLVSEVRYYVTATVSGREVKSNPVSTTGATYFPIHPYQMKLLPDKSLAVIRDYDRIFLVDYEQRTIVSRRQLSGKLGSFDLGSFNGQPELYVPSSNRNIYIIDPYDLSMIDTLNVSYPVHSVAVNSKGTIYFSCTHGQAPLRLYDRRTKTFMSQHPGESDSGILLKSDNELVAISSHLSPATMSFYTFDDKGVMLSKSNDPYSWDYEMDSERAKMSSKYIVTSTQGFVYTADASLTHVTTLSTAASPLTDFEFSDDGSTIYSAVSSSRRISKRGINGSSSSFSTVGYPWVLARKGDEMIVLSSPEAFSPWNTTNQVILEKVTLK